MTAQPLVGLVGVIVLLLLLLTGMETDIPLVRRVGRVTVILPKGSP